MSFDAIAPHYRWLERVTAGSLLQRCRTAFIHELSDAQDILLLGEGRGRFLGELMRTNSDTRITCLDASARMLALTRTSIQKQGLSNDRVRFVHADVLRPDGSAAASAAGFEPWGQSPYDAVATHFFLDCFPPDQLGQVISTVAACTTPGTRWLISDFCVPDRGWQHLRARLILSSLYLFFRMATRLPARRLTAPDAYLKQAGFQLKQRRHFNCGLLRSDVWLKRTTRADDL